MREALKVEALAVSYPDRPLTDFGQIWTDRRERCAVVLALRSVARLPIWWQLALARGSSKIGPAT